jgi:2-polyprenyl-6-methoxyphenol hydroxylase-like FAD-dependent oxidoreductase
MTHQTDVDVLIIGAGPTGLTLACLLAQFEVSFRIIDKNKTITEKSKALGVQARTLELFEQLGIAEKAVSMGYPAKGMDLIVQGKRKATVNLDAFGKGVTKFPFMLILEQCKTEQLLLDKLNNLGQEVEWQKELVELNQQAQSVTATLTHYEHIEEIRARYVVAADGAKSTVRTLLKIPFIGGTYENRFMLADVAIDGPISREHVTLCLSQYGFAGFFPMIGEDRYRAIGIMPDRLAGVEENSAQIFSEIKRQSRLDLKISDSHWISTYKIHHRSVSQFQKQNCFFAGDAAHVHSPAGAQGMNTGIQDAFNLGWKLQLVLRGQAQEKLLKTYHEERFPIAQKLIRTTDQLFSFVTNPNYFMRRLRLFMLPSTLRFLISNTHTRTYIFKLISQTGIRYRKSSLSEQNFLSEADFKAGDRSCHISPDGCFHAFILGDPRAQEQMTIMLEKYFEGKIRVHTLNKSLDITSILQDFGISRDGLVLVRPDGYAAYCAEGLDGVALKKYLDRYFLSKDAQLQRDLENKEGFPFESFI